MAVMTKAQWTKYHKDRGSTPRGTYEQYVAAHSAKSTAPTPQAAPQAAPAAEPVVTPRPGPAPGSLDAAGERDMAALDEWNRLESEDIAAGESVNRLNYEDATRRAATDREENIRRTIASYGARGLLRSGLRAQGEAKVEAGHVDLLTALGRRWTEAQASAKRARDRLRATYEQRRDDTSRSSWDRLVAEYQAQGGSTVSPGTAPAAAAPPPQASPPATQPYTAPWHPSNVSTPATATGAMGAVKSPAKKLKRAW